MRSAQLTAVSAALAITALIVSIPSIAQPVTTGIDNLVGRWLSTERQRNRIEARWIERKPELERQLALLNAEADALASLHDRQADEQGDVETRRQEILAEQTELEREQQRLEQALQRSLTLLRNMRSRLPPPLRDEWRMALDRIAPDSNSSVTLESVLRMMQLLRDFEDRIVVHRTTRAIGDDPRGENNRVEITEIYLGIARGWYVSPTGEFFGSGSSTSDGWQWQPGPSAEMVEAGALLTLLNVLDNNNAAQWVQLPITLGDEH